MPKSTLSADRIKATDKPAKPHKDFPLYAHGSGRWAKKVKGKTLFFGKWDDPDAALNKWLDEKDDLLAGRTPRPKGNALAIRDLCNSFLTHKKNLLDSGELAPRTFDRLKANTDLLVAEFGKNRPVDDLIASDFEALRASMAKRWGPVSLGNEIQMVRSVFKYGFEAGLLDKPIRFGPGFKKPSAKTLRMNRTSNGPKLFDRADVLALLKCASPNMKAMTLLGINGGLGNTDLGLLHFGALDMDGAWLNYPRPKTGMPRRVPLWPETIEAIREVIATRRAPKNDGDAALVFIGSRGESYIGKHKGFRVTQAFDRLTAMAKVEGRTFYDLRRTFQTVAEGSHDMVAIQSIMGHAPASGDMSSVYRQGVSDDRLRAVVEVVRAWLFAKKRKAK